MIGNLALLLMTVLSVVLLTVCSLPDKSGEERNIAFSSESLFYPDHCHYLSLQKLFIFCCWRHYIVARRLQNNRFRVRR